MSQQAKFATPEEHIAELYRRIDVLHEIINGVDAVFYPICITLYAHAPDVFQNAIEGIAQARKNIQQEQNAPTCYLTDRFVAAANQAHESIERIKTELASAEK